MYDLYDLVLRYNFKSTCYLLFYALFHHFLMKVVKIKF